MVDASCNNADGQKEINGGILYGRRYDSIHDERKVPFEQVK